MASEVVAVARHRRRANPDSAEAEGMPGDSSSSPSDDEGGLGPFRPPAAARMFKSRSEGGVLKKREPVDKDPAPVLPTLEESHGLSLADMQRSRSDTAAASHDPGTRYRQTGVSTSSTSAAGLLMPSLAGREPLEEEPLPAPASRDPTGHSQQDASSVPASGLGSSALGVKSLRKVSFATPAFGEGTVNGDGSPSNRLHRELSLDRASPENPVPLDEQSPLRAGWGDSESGYSTEELKDLDEKVISELFEKTKAAKEQRDNYKNAFFFLVFACLYFAILYLQANAGVGYEVADAHSQLLPNGFSGSQPNSFAGPADFYQWLNNTILQVLWQDPVCGDGTCSAPLEYAAFGPFGCELDCGHFANSTNLTVSFQQNFDSEQSRQDSSWNLCMVSPASQCWFPMPQLFPSVTGSFTQTIEVIDGDWKVLITAPNGGVSGTMQGPPPAGVDANFSDLLLLAQWGQCLPPAQSQLAQCRQACGNMTACLAASCPTATQAKLAGAMVDCVHQCDLDTSPVLGLANFTCAQVVPSAISLLHFNCSADASTTPGPGLATAAVEPTGPPIGVLLPPVARQALWASLGSTDDQRLFHIKVAVNRLLYTQAKDNCLVDQAKNLTAQSRATLSAFLCTLFGGNASLPGCSYNGATTVEQLWWYMLAAHRGAGRDISFQHQERFVSLVVAALASVVSLDDSDQASLLSTLHVFDSAVVNASNPGCRSAEGPVLTWQQGEQHNTTIFAGNRVTWVWGDDMPHSIKASGATASSTFQGMGSNRMVVSRLTDCSPLLMRTNEDSDVPTPCVLRPTWEATQEFTYTQMFTTPGTYTYTGGRLGTALSGVVNVRPASEATVALAAMPASMTQECAPGCHYSMLSDGQCNAACNVPECAFDGGDCSCVQPGMDFPFCACPAGQSRSSMGVCCESSCVGQNLNFSFSLRTYGPNYFQSSSIISNRGTPLERYVGRNRVLIGLMLTQLRVAGVPCSSSLSSSLAQCTGGASTQSFGVNPHFLPSSALYDPDSQEEIDRYGNNSFAFGLELTAEGLPYGFIWPQNFLGTGIKGYPLVFDINLNNQGATNRLQYLVDGFYLDNATSSITASIITYNGDAEIFTVTRVYTNVNEGGSYAATYNVQAIPVDSYTWTTANIIRFVMELIYMCALGWNLLEEAFELIHTKVETGFARNYFRSVWNWIDLLSMAIQVSGIGLWIYIQTLAQATYTIQPRYEIYFSLLEFPRYWAMPSPPTGFLDAVAALENLNQLITVRYIYFAMQGINVFLVTLRLLKLLDFQPYLGIITRSVAVAAPALLHFFVVWLVVFMSFALFAFLVFGSSLEQFNTLWRSFLTCFLVMMNDNSVEYFFIYMTGWEYVAGMIWWFAFTCVIIFVLLNFLIAIIVEAFMDMKEAEQNPSTIAEDMRQLLRRSRGRMFTKYWRYEPIIRDLYSLGADELRKEQASSMRRNSLTRALRSLNIFELLRKSDMFHPVEPMKMVLKVKGGQQCIDPISLSNVVQRSYQRNVEPPGSKRSNSGWSQRLQDLATISSHQRRKEELEGAKLDQLSNTLMGMFGEEVEASKVKPLMPLHHTSGGKKQEMMEIKGRLEALQEDTAESFDELRSMILDLKNQISALQQSSSPGPFFSMRTEGSGVATQRTEGSAISHPLSTRTNLHS